jgi:hypothetical protein
MRCAHSAHLPIAQCTVDATDVNALALPKRAPAPSTGQTIGNPGCTASAQELEFLQVARQVLLIHVDDRGMCLGCAEMWARLAPSPCPSARWAEQVLTAGNETVEAREPIVPDELTATIAGV